MRFILVLAVCCVCLVIAVPAAAAPSAAGDAPAAPWYELMVTDAWDGLLDLLGLSSDSIAAADLDGSTTDGGAADDPNGGRVSTSCEVCDGGATDDPNGG